MTLVYPSIVALASSETPLDFFGIPLSMVSYTSSVIPIVLVWLQSYVEKWLAKVLPGMIRNFSVPLLVFLVMVFPHLAHYRPGDDDRQGSRRRHRDGVGLRALALAVVGWLLANPGHVQAHTVFFP